MNLMLNGEGLKEKEITVKEVLARAKVKDKKRESK